MPLSPQPIKAALSGSPSGAMFTKENIPSSSLDNFFSVPLLLSFEQEVTAAGIIAVAPNNAELVKKSLRFI